MSDLSAGTFLLTSSDLASGALIPSPLNADLVKIYVNLGTAGTTASTVTVNKNGTAVASAVATVAIGATKGNAGIANPYVGVNAAAGAWTDQPVAGVQPGAYPASTGGVNNTPPLASFNAGDNISATVALGTSAAGATFSLVFQPR